VSGDLVRQLRRLAAGGRALAPRHPGTTRASLARSELLSARGSSPPSVGSTLSHIIQTSPTNEVSVCVAPLTRRCHVCSETSPRSLGKIERRRSLTGAPGGLGVPYSRSKESPPFVKSMNDFLEHHRPAEWLRQLLELPRG